MKLKHFLLIIFLLLIFLFINISSYSSQVFTELQDNIFRLHILANSDSIEDQNLKLKVRDEIIKYIQDINCNSTSKQDTISTVANEIENIQLIATQTIANEGYPYPVSVDIGNFYFPTKYYGNISLPAGNYDALKINIGEAKGQNWWCSLFPPLCFIDISSGYVKEEDYKILEENLDEEQFILISSNSPDVKLKFKIVEMLQNNNFIN